MNEKDESALNNRVIELEKEIQDVRSALKQRQQSSTNLDYHIHNQLNDEHSHTKQQTSNGAVPRFQISFGPSMHNLMLLSDSALPLGSFAYSSGLESFLAHNKPLPSGTTLLSIFQKFIDLSVQSIAYTNIPYILASYRHPQTLLDLDNDLDASTPCTVARRASVAQGRALLSIWEKAFMLSIIDQQEIHSLSTKPNSAMTVVEILKTFSRTLKIGMLTPDELGINGHLAPLWGAVCLALGLSIQETGYLFLLNHARAVISAGIRASVLGPYMAQALLAGNSLQELIRASLEKVWHVLPEDAGQVVPIMDLWMGRHELLYSRIFNS